MPGNTAQGKITAILDVFVKAGKVSTADLNKALETRVRDSLRNAEKNLKPKQRTNYRTINLTPPVVKFGLRPGTPTYVKQQKEIRNYQDRLNKLSQTLLKENRGPKGQVKSAAREGLVRTLDARAAAYSGLGQSLKALTLDAPSARDFKRYNESLKEGDKFFNNKKFRNPKTLQKYKSSLASVAAFGENQKTLLNDFRKNLSIGNYGDRGQQIFSTGLTKQINGLTSAITKIKEVSKRLKTTQNDTLRARANYNKKVESLYQQERNSAIRQDKILTDKRGNKRTPESLDSESRKRYLSELKKARGYRYKRLEQQILAAKDFSPKEEKAARAKKATVDRGDSAFNRQIDRIRAQGVAIDKTAKARSTVAKATGLQRDALNDLTKSTRNYNKSSTRSLAGLDSLRKKQNAYHRSLINTGRSIRDNGLIQSASYRRNQADLARSEQAIESLDKKRKREVRLADIRKATLGRTAYKSAFGSPSGVAREDLPNVSEYLAERRARLNRYRDSLLSRKDPSKYVGRVDKINGALNENAKSLDRVNTRMHRLNNAAKQVSSTLRLFFRYALGYGALYQMLAAVKGLVTGLTTLDERLQSIRAISNATTKQTLDIRSAVKSVAVTTEFNIAEIASAAQVLAQAGTVPEAMEGALRNVALFASATNTSLATSADVISTMKNVFTELSDNTIADLLTKAVNISKLTGDGLKTILSRGLQVSRSYNIAAEHFLGAVTVLRNAGIRDSTVSTGLRQAVLELLSPDPKTTKVLRQRYAELGEDLSDSAIKAKFFAFSAEDNPLLSVLKEFRRLGAGGSAKAAFDRVIDVRAANVVNVLINKIDELDQSFAKLGQGGAATQGTLTQLESLNKANKNLGAVIISLSDTLSGEFVQSLAKASQAMTQFLKDYEDTTLKVRAGGREGTSDFVTSALVGIGAARSAPGGAVSKGVTGVVAGGASFAGLKKARGSGLEEVADTAGIGVGLLAIALLFKRVRGLLKLFRLKSIKAIRSLTLLAPFLRLTNPLGWLVTLGALSYQLFKFLSSNSVEGRIKAAADRLAKVKAEADKEQKGLDSLDVNKVGSVASRVKKLLNTVESFSEGIADILSATDSEVKSIADDINALGAEADSGSSVSKALVSSISKTLGREVTPVQAQQLVDLASSVRSANIQIGVARDQIIARFSDLYERDPETRTESDKAELIVIRDSLDKGLVKADSSIEIAKAILQTQKSSLELAIANTEGKGKPPSSGFGFGGGGQPRSNPKSSVESSTEDLVALETGKLISGGTGDLAQNRAQLLKAVTRKSTDTDVAEATLTYLDGVKPEAEATAAEAQRILDGISSGTARGNDHLRRSLEDNLRKANAEVARIEYLTTTSNLVIAKATDLAAKNTEDLLTDFNNVVESAKRIADDPIRGKPFQASLDALGINLSDIKFKPASDGSASLESIDAVSDLKRAISGSDSDENLRIKNIKGKSFKPSSDSLINEQKLNSQLDALNASGSYEGVAKLYDELETLLINRVTAERTVAVDKLQYATTKEAKDLRSNIDDIDLRNAKIKSDFTAKDIALDRDIQLRSLDLKESLYTADKAALEFALRAVDVTLPEGARITKEILVIDGKLSDLASQRLVLDNETTDTADKIRRSRDAEAAYQAKITLIAARRAKYAREADEAGRLTDEQLRSREVTGNLSRKDRATNLQRLRDNNTTRTANLERDRELIGDTDSSTYQDISDEIRQLREEAVLLDIQLDKVNNTLNQAVRDGFNWGDIRTQIESTTASVENLAETIRNSLVKAYNDVGDAIADAIVDGDNLLTSLKRIIYEVARENAKAAIKTILNDTLLSVLPGAKGKEGESTEDSSPKSILGGIFNGIFRGKSGGTSGGEPGYGAGPAGGAQNSPSARPGGEAQSAIGKLFSAEGGLFSTIGSGFQNIFSKLLDSGGSLFGTISGGFGSLFSGLLSGLGGGGGGGGADIGSSIVGLIAGSFGIPGFARGGVIGGRGSPTADDKLIRVSATEAVLNAKAVKNIGESGVNALNSGKGFSKPLSTAGNNKAIGLPTQAPPPVVENKTRIVNILDRDLAKDFMESADGEKIIVNAIRRNQGAVRQVLE